MNALVVDDDAGVRRLIEMILREAGYGVLTAESAEQALIGQAAAAKIGLLITDVRLKGMSGPDLDRALRCSNPSLQTLFISGYWLKLGLPQNERGHAFLEKPFTPEDLLQAVRKLLVA